jgi:lipopolysaccharide export system permease protein
MRTVRRLLYTEIIQAVAFVAVAFLALFYFIDLVEELQDVGRNGYRLQHAVLQCLLAVPGHLYDLFPIALLIGSTYAMAQFAQSSEFTILRTGGLGPVRALSLLATLGVAGGMLTFIIGDTLVPLAEQQGSVLQAQFHDGAAPRGGAWLRDTLVTPDGEHSYAVNVGRATDTNEFRDITIYEFDDRGHLLARTRASLALVSADGDWQMQGVRRNRFMHDPASDHGEAIDETLTSLDWHSKLTARVVAAAVLPLKTMSTRALYAYKNHLSEHEQAGQLYEIQFWKKTLYPLACLVMVSLALPFAYLHARSGGISLRVFIGIMLGISFVLVNNVSSHLGLLQGWMPWLAAATPSLVYMLLSLGAFTWLVRYR